MTALPEIARVTEICKIIGIKERRYYQLAQENEVPVPEKGKVNTVDAIQSYIAYLKKVAQGQGSLSLADERARLTKIQADMKELQLKKEQGELIEAEVALKLFTEVIQKMSSKLSAIPLKVAPLIIGCKTITEAKEILENLIEEVKAELKNPKIYKSLGSNTPSDSRRNSSKAQTKNKRVGRQK